MTDLVKPSLDLIYGAGLISAEAVAQELRERIIDHVDDFSLYSMGQLLEQVRKLLAEFEPILAENLAETELGAWVFGFDTVAKRTPKQILDELKNTPRFTPPPPPRFTLPGSGEGGGKPIVRFPLIEKAIDSLQRADILTRDRFDQLSNELKRRAFTYAGESSEDVIDRVRQALVEDLQVGTSLGSFRDRVAQQVGASFIGPSHLELVYRQNVQTAFHDGHDELANEPIVSDVFPYQEYLAIHDRRAREEHLALETLGLNGTGVYRRDDPMWDYFLPPWGFNCLLPGTVVEGSVKNVMRSWYCGDVVEFVTRNGDKVSITANHPVLSEEGFIPAHKLRKGDAVLSYKRDIDLRRQCLGRKKSSRFAAGLSLNGGFPPPAENKQHAPAAIEDILTTVGLESPLFRLPVAPHDLHGEAAFGKGYVDIVGSAGVLLRNVIYACALQRLRNFALPFSYPLLSLDSDHGFGGFRQDSPPGGFPSCGALPLDASIGQFNFLPFQSFRFGRGSQFDIRRIKPVVDDRPANSAGLGERINRLSGNVSFDDIRRNGDSGASHLSCSGLLGAVSDMNSAAGENAFQSGVADSRFYGEASERFARFIARDEITEIRNYKWSGHVYDAETETGWMFANNVIVSNCRCGVNLLTIRQAAQKGVREAIEWLRSGDPPINPEHRLQHIEFRPDSGFGARRSVAA